MLREDIIRSMASRTEMHCESLIDEEVTTQGDGENTGKVYHEIPRRVFTHFPGNDNLLASDYLFPGEGPKCSFGSFRDILGFQIEDDKEIISDLEKPFGK